MPCPPVFLVTLCFKSYATGGIKFVEFSVLSEAWALRRRGARYAAQTLGCDLSKLMSGSPHVRRVHCIDVVDCVEIVEVLPTSCVISSGRAALLGIHRRS